MARPKWSGSSSRHLFRAVLTVMALCFPLVASAEVEPIALQYEAPAACPDEAEFIAWIEAHTRRFRRVPLESAAVRTIRVSVTAGKPEASGSLRVRAVDGTVTERTIAGPTCAEVAEALAVMVAVAIEPRTRSPSGEPGPKEKDETPSVVSLPASTPPPPPARVPEAVPGRLRFSVDLRAETTSAVLRGALPGVGASLTVDPSVPAARRGVRIADPSVAVGIRRSFPLERALRGGSADFSWTAGHLRLCPLKVVVDGRVEISPCAEANLGGLRASASGFAEARGTSTLWFDLGASLFTTVSLSRGFFLSSTVLVAVPLFRQPFTLASGAPVASVPPLGVLGGLGLGLRM